MNQEQLPVLPVPCALCNTRVDIELTAAPQILNKDHVTIVVIEHGNFGRCPKCGTQVTLRLENIGNMQLTSRAIRERSQIVVPASSLT